MIEGGWVCRACWRANRPQDSKCYRCTTPRDLQATVVAGSLKETGGMRQGSTRTG